ncbi:trypsin-like [Macrosteles quadrilineatus]|uniref:trypsin-like n=1 Tax=Macrosteles quadrilineatus TaxID=74068 RepID=UPI0023E21F40|nr:trypsin-like [Macrosteles quadrilineatus]
MFNTTLHDAIFVVLIISIQELRFQPGYYVESTCTGTLIREDTVLTAAHCFRNKSLYEPTEVRIKLLTGSVRRVNEVFVHPNFSDGCDLAILTHTSIGRPEFPKLPAKHLTTNQTCFSAGYGGSHVLKLIPVDLSTSFLGRVKTFFTVLFSDGSPCRGDSGGPLICGNVLYGVLSQGTVTSCMDRTGIVLYEDVFQDLPWIQQFLDRPVISHSWKNKKWIAYFIFGLLLVLFIVTACLVIV